MSDNATHGNQVKKFATEPIQRLEKSLGSILLNRTTRSVGITRAGEIYYETAVNMLADYDKLTENLDFVKKRISGELRVTAPLLWGESILTPLIIEFKRKYKDVSVLANYSDQFVDLYRENIHIAFRTTIPENEPYPFKEICADTSVICAGKRHLEGRVALTKPADLEKLNFITFGQDINRYTELALRQGDETAVVRARGDLSFTACVRFSML